MRIRKLCLDCGNELDSQISQAIGRCEFCLRKYREYEPFDDGSISDLDDL